jgi:hypothetical protein
VPACHLNSGLFDRAQNAPRGGVDGIQVKIPRSFAYPFSRQYLMDARCGFPWSGGNKRSGEYQWMVRTRVARGHCGA